MVTSKWGLLVGLLLFSNLAPADEYERGPGPLPNPMLDELIPAPDDWNYGRVIEPRNVVGDYQLPYQLPDEETRYSLPYEPVPQPPHYYLPYQPVPPRYYLPYQPVPEPPIYYYLPYEPVPLPYWQPAPRVIQQPRFIRGHYRMRWRY